MSITTRDELEALEFAVRRTARNAAPTPAQDARTPRLGREVAPPTPAPALILPPPADGCTYGKAEVGQILGVAKTTVEDWVYRGLAADSATGERVRLQALRAPRGRIAPHALCRFLAAVNGCPVRIEETAENAEARRDGGDHAR